MIATLTRSEVRRASKDLRARGLKLPRVGWSICLSNGSRIAHDAKGYYFVTGSFERGPDEIRW